MIRNLHVLVYSTICLRHKSDVCEREHYMQRQQLKESAILAAVEIVAPLATVAFVAISAIV